MISKKMIAIIVAMVIILAILIIMGIIQIDVLSTLTDASGDATPGMPGGCSSC